ncbi:hypothetical protein JVU11DRAFT_2908 [Chiua virens]|nr:hypothetical protein JVU11DRAFT_2908 [Chiua virens]
MRLLALVAAITIMHTAYALPASSPDLAVRRGVNDLSNDKHIFHHLDRNQRTANRDRNRVHGDNEGPGLHVVKRLPDRPQRAKLSEAARKGERVRE